MEGREPVQREEARCCCRSNPCLAVFRGEGAQGERELDGLE